VLSDTMEQAVSPEVVGYRPLWTWTPCVCNAGLVAGVAEHVVPVVVYLCAAGNSDGPVRSRSHRVNQPALASQIKVPEPDAALFICLRAHLAHSTPRSSPSPAAYTHCGGGHGGTRNSSTSRNVQA
jgi:hypothetical protein